MSVSKKAYNLVFLMFAILPCSFAQKEMNTWYFGYNAGLSFNNGSPEAISGGLVYSGEGCSSVSDENGNLLFYSDGMRIWNRAHQLMPNSGSLAGDTIASQSALIVQKPGSLNEFYIFTGGAVENENGDLHYSIVDMRLDNGMGDVAGGTKNTLLARGTCEKISAVKHNNTNDVWLITHLFNSDEFLVYFISCNGIETSPRRVRVGSMVDGRVGNAIGYLKVSPDGTKIAMANFRSEVEVFDFNNNTGAITNAIKLGDNPGKACRAYGVEFSPNSKLLYVTSIYNCGDFGDYDIDQWDLTAADVPASRLNLISSRGNAPGALQLGIDHRIYIAYNNSRYLGAIINPDQRGAACALNEQAVLLSGNATSGLGLPNAISGFTRTLLTQDTLICEDFVYERKIPLENTSYLWNTGSSADSITINQHGKYWVTITTGDNCVYSDSIIITRHNSESAISLGEDTILCEGGTLLLDVSQTGDKFLWHDNSTDPVYSVKAPGTYSVLVEDEGCYSTDTINVGYKTAPNAELGPDLQICPGEELVLNPVGGAVSYNWSDGSTGQTMMINRPGSYRVTVSNECGSSSDEIYITEKKCEIRLPNAFTPSKTTNRVFKLSNAAGVSDFSMQVFNRWGQVIYKSTDPGAGWDGRMNGVLQPPGTYVYIVIYKNPIKPETEILRGTVLLLF